MTWIETIDEDEAQGPLQDHYQAYMKKSGSPRMPNILKAFSLSPDASQTHYNYYNAIAFGKGPLRRYQREMIATLVSRINSCHY